MLTYDFLMCVCLHFYFFKYASAVQNKVQQGKYQMFFEFHTKIINCEYSLESPHCGDSNENQQYLVDGELWEINL